MMRQRAGLISECAGVLAGKYLRAIALITTSVMVLSSTVVSAEPSKGLRRFGAKIEISEPQKGTVIAGGARVAVSGGVDGDVYVTGADVSIEGLGVGGVMAAGAEVKVSAPIASSATLVGSRVSLGAPVAGDVTAMGGSIEIGPEAVIGGQVKLYAASVTFNGQAADRVSIESDEVVFLGSAKGSVRIEGLNVKIADGARITGSLDIFTIGDPEIAPGAQIAAKPTIHRLHDSSSMRAYLRGLPFHLIIPTALAVSALIAGMFLLWLGRGGVERVTDELIDSPGSSVFWGISAMVLLPVLAVLLGLTVLGLPMSVLTVLALPFLLLLGFASAGFGIGEWIFNRLGEPRTAGQRALQLLGGLIILALLGLLPFAGPWILIVAGITGFGALLRSLHDGMRGRSII
jgi:cytoskeletal protein CcmA (bactofilin family)